MVGRTLERRGQMAKIAGIYSDAGAFHLIFDWSSPDIKGMTDAIWANLTGLDEFSEEEKR